MTSDENSSSVGNGTLLQNSIVPTLAGPTIKRKHHKKHSAETNQEQPHEGTPPLKAKHSACGEEEKLLGEDEEKLAEVINTNKKKVSTAETTTGIPFWLAHESKSKRLAVNFHIFM